VSVRVNVRDAMCVFAGLLVTYVEALSGSNTSELEFMRKRTL